VRYRLALAGALSARHDDDAARQVLLRLRESRSYDPDVNVQLARLEARQHDAPAAVRYYENALYGLWNSDQLDARRRLRIELVNYLLEQGQQSRALSEILILSGNLPDEVAWQNDAGGLFLRAGDMPRALDHFTRALRLDARNAQALTGAGQAAFALQDYARAQQYLQAAPKDLGRTGELLTVTNLVLANDPLAPRLRLAERLRRVHAALLFLRARLEACRARRPDTNQQARNDLDTLRLEIEETEPTLTFEQVRESPEVIDAGFDLIYRVERSTRSTCDEPAAMDRALQLIARRHGIGQQ